MKKTYYFLLFAILLLIPLSSQAYVIKSSDFIYVAKDEIVEGNLYFNARSLTIEGKVLGDVIGIGPNIKINGQVSGDVISISQNIAITGQVDGNVRAVANVLNISGQVGRNVNFFGESFILGEDGLIGQDILIKSINSEFNGKVKGYIHGESNNVLIRGEVDKNVNLVIDKKKRKKYLNVLQIDESALISGTVVYQAGQEAIIKSENIAGEINKREPNKSGRKIPTASRLFYSILSTFLMAILINYLFKNKINKLTKVIIEQNYKIIAYGAIILFLTPIAVLILMITIVGIPIAIIALFLWIILLFLSRILVAIALGDYIFKILKREEVPKYLKILSGVVLVCLLFVLPYVGWLFSLTTILAGLGSIYYIIKHKKYVN